ncbi:hypothetical protein F511_45871 [Dorcoceras hygrometricum]|uniref:Uncharacterized protein n=1 Tax=Dorcoceras hygrometricum TaxID=472368 RepID=A0A2Z6ZUX0_9LAMI|nr:hypothetical protein F511_45871 [Dorcoceras hygrometricum]
MAHWLRSITTQAARPRQACCRSFAQQIAQRCLQRPAIIAQQIAHGPLANVNHRPPFVGATACAINCYWSASMREGEGAAAHGGGCGQFTKFFDSI